MCKQNARHNFNVFYWTFSLFFLATQTQLTYSTDWASPSTTKSIYLLN